jgi:23S rRNA (guanosine2251-2'-O)-methyltransferase
MSRKDHDRAKGRRREREARRQDEGPTLLYGIHAVEAALANPRRTVSRLFVTDNAEHRLAKAIVDRQARPERVTARDLDRRLGPDTVHQGVLLETEPLPEPSLAHVAESGPGPVVVLDQVTDPHNVGAILRSAAVFGAAGVVMTRRHSPPLAGALAKSASGALEQLPVALVGNLATAIAELGALDYRRLGLDGEAERLLEDEPLDGRIALVLGAEGKGLRQLTRERCDRLCRIAAAGPIASLNVSNAAAVALHLVAMRQRAARPG